MSWHVYWNIYRRNIKKRTKMDREISNAEIQKRRNKNILWVALAAVAIAISVFILRGGLQTSLKQIKIARALKKYIPLIIKPG